MRQILISGYSSEDAQGIQQEIYEMLKPCQFTLAITYDEYLSFIKKLLPDLIISNYQSSAFEGLTALRIAKETHPSIPFIFFCHLDDIQTAIECLKEGASDFILKKNINNLPSAAIKAIEQKKNEEDALHKGEQELRRQNELMTSLILKSDWFNEDLIVNIRRIIEIASELIQTERVSVWKYNEDLSKVKCIGLYEKSLKRHSAGEELLSSEFPNYTASHSNGKVIATVDVFTDHRTAQIPYSYFQMHGITSLLDAPVYVGGKLTGLLSFEQVGEKRKWNSIDERLSLNIATHISLCFEIDDRKRIEKALRDSEAMYHTIFDGSSEGFFIMTDKFIDCNEQVCNIWRCSKEDIIGHHPSEFSPYFQPDGRISEEASKQYIEAAMNGVPQRFYWRHKRKDGVLIDVEISLTSITVEEQQVIFATMVDITERKCIEDALRLAEEKYKNIFENAVEGIFQTTAEGQFITANPALAQMYGYNSPEEFLSSIKNIGKQLYNYPHVYIELLRILREKGFVHNFVIIARRKDRSTFWVSLNAKVIRDDKGKIKFFEGMVQDITEQKKLEEQLRQSQKMEAVGTLAGGVAHDFNNILTVIMGYTHLMLMKLKDDNILHPYLNQILAAVEKATNLTNSLLAFSRKQMISFKPVEINSLIINLEKMLLRIIGEDIELKTFLSGDSLTIMADSNQIEQVLMNLASNARDAMPNGGLLIIETERIEMDEEYAKTHGYGKPGAYALITFTDFGIGIDKETIGKIFEPFFTTKVFGKGSGLGLSMAYGIIKQHNGYINCYSELGKGTTFKIYLPLTLEKLIALKSSVSITSVSGTEIILVAEDDENVRKLTKYILERYGYKVIEAVDGMDAVDKFTENKDNIDLLLFDVIMPKMNGKAAYEEIKKIQPNIQAVFMSGYTSNVIHNKGILEEGLNLIFKPVSPMNLLNKIREVISS